MSARPYTKAPLADPTYNWTGFYVGGHIGYGWGSDGGMAFTDYPAGAFAAAFASGQFPTYLKTDPTGVIGGVHLGYNFQSSSNWLLGLEGDFSGADIKGSALHVYPGGVFTPANVSANQSLDWLATIRGRVGYVVDRFMVYGTGGLAIGGVKSGFFGSIVGAPITVSGDVSDTRVGWAAGAGAEYAFAPNWSVKVEWLHYDLGNVTVIGPQLTAGVVQPFGAIGTTAMSGDIVSAGVSYRFGPIAAR